MSSTYRFATWPLSVSSHEHQNSETHTHTHSHRMTERIRVSPNAFDQFKSKSSSLSTSIEHSSTCHHSVPCTPIKNRNFYVYSSHLNSSARTWDTSFIASHAHTRHTFWNENVWYASTSARRTQNVENVPGMGKIVVSCVSVKLKKKMFNRLKWKCPISLCVRTSERLNVNVLKKNRYARDTWYTS